LWKFVGNKQCQPKRWGHARTLLGLKEKQRERKKGGKVETSWEGGKPGNKKKVKRDLVVLGGLRKQKKTQTGLSQRDKEITKKEKKSVHWERQTTSH